MDWSAPFWQGLELLDVRLGRGIEPRELARVPRELKCLTSRTFTVTRDEAAVEAEEAR